MLTLGFGKFFYEKSGPGNGVIVAVVSAGSCKIADFLLKFWLAVEAVFARPFGQQQSFKKVGGKGRFRKLFCPDSGDVLNLFEFFEADAGLANLHRQVFAPENRVEVGPEKKAHQCKSHQQQKTDKHKNRPL